MAADRNSLESQPFNQMQALMLQQPDTREDDLGNPSHALARQSRISPGAETRHLVRPNADTQLPPLSRSAPEMGLLLNKSYPQALDEKRAAMSFNVFDELDGDTQPMPSQVYHGYNHVTHEESVGLHSLGGTPQATGNVDLLEDWDTQLSVPDHLRVHDVHSIDESAEDDGSQGLLSSMKRDTQPKTPAFAGFKRNRNGTTISPTTASKTPGSGLSAMFGPLNTKAPMTATQLFENTQAVSSPVLDGPRSDPLESRPSPDFMRTAAYSSPIKSDTVQASRPLTGPRDVYRSVNESQLQRRRRLGKFQQASIPASSSKVLFDDSQMSEDYAAIPDTARKPYPLMHAHPLSEESRIRPFQASADVDAQSEPADDNPVIEVSDHESLVGDDESVDEYDEYSQDIIPSQGKVRKVRTASRLGTPEILETEMEVAGSPAVVDGSSKNDQFKSGAAGQIQSSNRDRLTIANSQPLKSSEDCPPRPIEPSSLSSFVPGSQVALPSSQMRALVDAQVDDSKYSSLPMPPMTSPLIEESREESNIPSSPPAMNLERTQGEGSVLATKPQTPGTPAYAALFEQSKPLVQSSGIDERLISPKKVLVDGITSASQGAAHTGAKEKQHRPLVTDGNTLFNASDSNKTSLFATAATHISTSEESSAAISQGQKSISESPQKSGQVRRFADIAKDPIPPGSADEVDLSIAMDIVGDEDRDFLENKQPVRQPSKGKLRRIHKAKATDLAIKSVSVEIEEGARDGGNIDDDPVNVPRESDKAARTDYSRKRRKVDHRRKQTGVRKIADGEPEKDSGLVDEADNAASTDDGRIDSVDPSQKDQAPVEVQPQSPSGSLPDPTSRASRQQPTTEVRDDQSGPDAVHSLLAHHQPVPTSVSAACDVQAPSRNRVFALFNGSVNGYYPATCTSVAHSGLSVRYNVKFDDGTRTSLERHHVCAFDLYVGDAVKVDLPSMRAHMYIVHGFGEQEDGGIADNAPTDIHGHRFVELRLKRKDSARNPRVAAATAAIDRPVTIPIGAIYVTQSMWVKFNSRTYDHDEPSRQQTPSVDVSAPSTPSSRARRQTLTSAQIPALVPSVSSRAIEGSLFNNMAFAVSYSTSDSDISRNRLISLITSQSGLVVCEGLHELFEPPPSTKSPYDHTLRLKPEYSSLGFVALIGDSHSRNQKYIQALALTLPTLHYKWAEDSARAGHAVPWGKYLLPAGCSKLLSDAVRSRTIPTYDPTSATLTITLRHRDRLLPADAGVLLLADKKKDMRRVYAFLSLAMGAGRIAFVDSISEAKEMLKGGEWGWVHCAADALGRVVEELGGETTGAISRGGKKGKRKRSLLANEELEEDKLDVTLSSGVRVVGDEWVIQSLILGSMYSTGE